MRNTLPGPSAVHPDQADDAIALWTTGPGVAELRPERQRQAGEGEASVRTLWTGVSRGTESIVARGDVPQSERERMRAPFQEGDFPFPVKYGYLNVGVVEEGPPEWRGSTVFSLRPHQSGFVASVDTLVPVPDAVPARRAVLAGAVETAVNVLWDARPLIGDRVVVVGAGMIGCSVAALLRGIPGLAVTLVDTDATKSGVASALGARFAAPDDAPCDADVVIEASGSAAGLSLALRLAPTDGEVIVASWYGNREVPLQLGADFHSRRLTIRSTQVGAVAPTRRGRRTTGERLALAVRLLEDPVFDALLGGSSGWRELPSVISSLAAGTADEMCHTIDWSAE